MNNLQQAIVNKLLGVVVEWVTLKSEASSLRGVIKVHCKPGALGRNQANRLALVTLSIVVVLKTIIYCL